MNLDVQLDINKIVMSPNVAEMLDDSALTTIGSNVVQEFLLDKQSRSVWEKRVEEAT